MVVGALGGRTGLAVIGAGPGGYVAALRAADAGLEVTLIDAGPLGGTCLNVGCIPSKTLLEVAALRARARATPALGLTQSSPVDMGALHAQIESVTDGLRNGVRSLLDHAGVTVVHGTARFVRYDRLSVLQGDEVRHIEFDDVVVATGSRPAQVLNFPLGDRVVNSSGLLAQTELPASLAIIGGGYIGIEMATAFSDLGSIVTVVESADRILPDLPLELSRVVQRALLARGVRVVTGGSADRLTPTGIVLASADEIDAELIVVAAGRVPNSDALGLSEVGVSLSDSGHVIVGPDMAAAANIYAIGDLVVGPALAHKATAEAEIAVANIVGENRVFDPAAVPQVVYSRPEIMSVGLPPEQATAAGASVHRFPHSASARAATLADTSGLTLVVCDPVGTVVGVHAVGPHVSELAGEATLAIEMAATLQDLALTIHPHPTMSETLTEAALLALGTPLHIRK